MPFSPASDVSRRAKSYLAYCYRSGVIGPYRRLHTVWILSRADGELVLDDHEVVSYMNCAIEADPELAQSLEGRTKRYGASLEAIIDN
jgi:hypothetical protein